jgi:hypothetical protein
MSGKNGNVNIVTENAGLPGLSKEHYQALKASAIADEVILERGYRTVTDGEELRKLGFSVAQSKRTPALLLPIYTTDGLNSLCSFRPDNPLVEEIKDGKRNPDGTWPCKVHKYEWKKWQGMRLDCPKRCLPALGDLGKPLWITEGQKKADALASAGLCAIALLGVWNFKGKNDFGATTFLADWDYIGYEGRDIWIVFDSDVITKPNVRKALERLTEHLQRKGATIGAVYLPGDKNGKVGVDDWLAAGHTVEELNGLVETPRPTPKAAPPRVELLDTAPTIVRRPLALISGQGYAAVWPYVKMTIFERVDNDGKVYQLSQPEEKTERQLHLMRGDGVIFGPYGEPFSLLGLDVQLPETPQGEKLWSTPGIKAFIGGYRPEPADVFKRVKAVVNRFMDFERSLADQEAMGAMMACYVISSWMLDAFSVASFLWINGEQGCGKTSLLLTLTELSYLGQALSPSGSFASLRDLADYGATLGLDDAEDLSDPQKSDPDKRALLLSGNRRGVVIPLKEIGPNGQWQTRYVNGYCPRIFSAIAKPDPVLSSRTLIIPLVRTAERYKGNSDPLDYGQWPYERQKLIDDLWGLAVSRLPELPAFDTRVKQNGKLIGRDLQPWQSLLAVAAWLDKSGVEGLWATMESLAAETYQKERNDLEVGDVNRVLVKALGEFAMRMPAESEWEFATQEIVTLMYRLIDDEEIDLGAEKINSRSVGKRIKKMRFQQIIYARPRRWSMSREALIRQFKAYQLDLPEKIGQITMPLPVGENG